uniref:C-type lectin domain-containing protein n=1 Tax=Oreochromis aureus TaxID=47969 RepID=A0AAZ1WYA5_OREAU
MMFEYLSILCLSSGEHLVEKRSTCFRDFWGWTKYGNQYFQFFPNQLTWAQAQRHCQALNANLASVRNLGEYQAIQRVILNGARNNVPTWIGVCNGKNALSFHFTFLKEHHLHY